MEAPLACRRVRNRYALAQEAVERLVDYDQWLIRKIKSGIAAADRGEFDEHWDIYELINRRYRG